MSNNVEALTTASLSLALDAASLRQQVIAANIANASRSGYVAQRASFEAQFSDLSRSVQLGEFQAGPTSPPPVELNMRVEPDLGPDGRPQAVHLDSEVAAMSQNSLHYQALIKGLSRHLSILSSAVADGKR